LRILRRIAGIPVPRPITPRIFDATPPVFKSRIRPRKLEIIANMIAMIDMKTAVL